MKKIFLLASLIGIMFTISNPTAEAVEQHPCPSGQVYIVSEGSSGGVSGFVGCVTAPVSLANATVGVSADRFYVGYNGLVTVTITTLKNFPVSSWGSTRLILEGQNNVCINHGNHPLTSSQTYTEKLELKSPDAIGQYDLLVQPFVTDDCITPIGNEILQTAEVRKKLLCLNCGTKGKEVVEDKKAENNVISKSDNTTSPNADTQKRQERKQKVDTFIQTYQNNPDFKEILFLIQLLVALDIIQI